MKEYLQGFRNIFTRIPELKEIDKLKYVIANLVYNVVEENQIYDLVTLTGHQKLISFMPQMLRFQLNLCQRNFEKVFFFFYFSIKYLFFYFFTLW